MSKSLNEWGRFLALVLRHKPQAVGIELDAHGWAQVEALLAAFNRIERLYVHLSANVETAHNVGKRHGEPFIYTVLAGEMARAGYKFYLSANGVWLTECVPKKFLRD